MASVLIKRRVEPSEKLVRTDRPEAGVGLPTWAHSPLYEAGSGHPLEDKPRWGPAGWLSPGDDHTHASTTASLANKPVSPAFKIHPESNHFLCLPPRPLVQPPSLLTWTAAAPPPPASSPPPHLFSPTQQPQRCRENRSHTPSLPAATSRRIKVLSVPGPHLLLLVPLGLCLLRVRPASPRASGLPRVPSRCPLGPGVP